jgi:hypothetical protein
MFPFYRSILMDNPCQLGIQDLQQELLQIPKRLDDESNSTVPNI